MTEIASHLKTIRQRMAAARPQKAAEAELIAVSKGQPPAAIEAALKAGQLAFGENRVQEAKTKFALLRPHWPDLRLHMIGPLQTNKAEDAVLLFDVIETLDRPRLADALARAIKKLNRAPALYIEVNIGNEPQKAGIEPDGLGVFLAYCRTECGLTVTGLMAIPPQAEDTAPYFTKLKTLADAHGLPHISMGMSADFEAAIRCGATEVRVGSALFGPRQDWRSLA